MTRSNNVSVMFRGEWTGWIKAPCRADVHVRSCPEDISLLVHGWNHFSTSWCTRSCSSCCPPSFYPVCTGADLLTHLLEDKYSLFFFVCDIMKDSCLKSLIQHIGDWILSHQQNINTHRHTHKQWAIISWLTDEYEYFINTLSYLLREIHKSVIYFGLLYISS